MPERKKLKDAQDLFEAGRYPEARKLLESIVSKDANVRLNVLSALIGVLDHVTENDKLLLIATEGVELAINVNDKKMQNYFLGKKCFFLLSQLSEIIYQQSNLKLSARVFEWIDFSLETDKKSYEDLGKKRETIDREVNMTLSAVIKEAHESENHLFKGHQFSTIGDIYSHYFLVYKLAFQEGGRFRSKIANIYLVRRWNLDEMLYGKEARRKISKSRNKCIEYFEKSIAEFQSAGQKSEEAHAIYNLAVKLKIFNRFKKAKRLLADAKVKAQAMGEKRLLEKIEVFEPELEDKNRNIPDYVSEMGLDLPPGLTGR